MNKTDLLTKQITEGVKEIITSSQTAMEKKIALFDFVEGLDVGELKPMEKQRVNHLLQSCLYSELAKKSMGEYKKITAEEFSKN